MTQPLKPCPFCWSKAVCISEDDTGCARWVFCTECECDGPCIDYRLKYTREQALVFVVNAWNQRSGN
jgi:hypothetical protein